MSRRDFTDPDIVLVPEMTGAVSYQCCGEDRRGGNEVQVLLGFQGIDRDL